MSKMGELNLDLQDQANELGYSTVQEALDGGYVCVYRKDGSFKLIKSIDKEHEDAHKAWENKKKLCIMELTMLSQASDICDVYKSIVKRAINFIKEGEV